MAETAALVTPEIEDRGRPGHGVRPMLLQLAAAGGRFGDRAVPPRKRLARHGDVPRMLLMYFHQIYG
ncbi:hypothetical protein [Streptomyces sp. NPDC014623]|uniref:hypothetical protein n=1 Tax=Streptomyces sp. NPDC014623 TaxID=3364875 RepID=UPI0036F84E5B